MEQLAWNLPRGRGSLWVNERGGVVDRTERSASSRSAPRASIFAGVDRLVPGGQARTVQGEKDGVPVLWAKAKNRTMSSCCGDKPAASCGGTPPLFVGAGQPRVTEPNGHTAARRVSGAWLKRVVTLDSDVAASVTDDDVEVDEDAWGAIQAIISTRATAVAARRKVAKRRAKFWSQDMEYAEPPQHKQTLWREGRADGGKASAIGLPTLLHPCACGARTIIAPDRFVDSSAGDDRSTGGLLNDGGIIRHRPWKSLRRVEKWLNEDIYDGHDPSYCVAHASVFLRRGRTWDGTEEPWSSSVGPASSRIPGLTPLDWASPANNVRSEQVILSIYGFKGIEGQELILTAYPPSPNNLSVDEPIIDGVIASVPSSEPQYADRRVGLALYDCCNVYMSNLRIRGFGTAIDVRGGSKHHIYSGLYIYDHAKDGIRVSVTKTDAEYAAPDGASVAAQIEYVRESLLYPEDITVSGCKFSSIGYDTAGGDVALNFLATNCNVLDNQCVGDDHRHGPRGVDGIASDGASSGHLIENNRIATHRKWCASGAYMCDPTTPQLQQTCTGGLGSSPPIPTDFGYSIHETAPTCTNSAWGEDGIDLKGVRRRTSTARRETIVVGNVIWGHTNFSGITINDGSQDIHILRNRIFLNETGIGVTNSWNEAWYHDYEPNWTMEKTENIYIYRNLVYMNFGRGLHISNALDKGLNFEVSGVYVVGNTVAHNLKAGVSVTVDSSTTTGVKKIHLANNLIARNGLEPDPGVRFPESDTMQLFWSRAIRFNFSGACSSTNNCYLGWQRMSVPTDLETVFRWGTQPLTVPDALELSIEVDSEQAGSLIRLGLLGRVQLAAMEDLALSSPVLLSLREQLETAAASVIESLGDGYDIGSLSLCADSGVASVGILQVFDDPSRDIALSKDIESVAVLFSTPDIGAFEGPVGADHGSVGQP